MNPSARVPLQVMRICWEVFDHVCQHRKLKVAIQESGRGAMMAGGAAFFGGLLLGPVGIALGGLVGGTVGAMQCRSESVIKIIMQMSEEEQQQLFQKLLMAAGQNVGLETLAVLLRELPQLQDIAIAIFSEMLGQRNMKLERC